jgi:hypothetical protein
MISRRLRENDLVARYFSRRFGQKARGDLGFQLSNGNSMTRAGRAALGHRVRQVHRDDEEHPGGQRHVEIVVEEGAFCRVEH